MNKKIALAALCLLGMSAVGAQSPEPTPAFAGQTDAPAPAKPSPPVDIKVVADGLTGAWAMAFLPDGNFLVTQSAGHDAHRPAGRRRVRPARRRA